MVKASAQNTISMRAHGPQTVYSVFDGPYPRRESWETTEPNLDFKLTFDIDGLNNPQKLVKLALRYEEPLILVSRDVDIWDRGGRVRQILPKLIDYRDTAVGMYQTYSEPRYFLSAHVKNQSEEVGFSVADDAVKYEQLAKTLDVPLDLVHLIAAHRALGSNVFVSDRPEMQRLIPYYFSDGKARWIRSTDLQETIHKMARRQGVFYVGPGDQMTPSNYYYWRRLHEVMPEFDVAWATALHGVEEANLEKELVEYIESFSDRAMGMLETAGELELLAEEKVDNRTKWRMVNKLNYFLVLCSGLTYNIAWLAALRHRLYSKYSTNKKMQVVLQVRESVRGKPDKDFHRELLQVNSLFYQHLQNYQWLIKLLHMPRDAVQHRIITRGVILEHLNEMWQSIMVLFEDDAIQLLTEQSPIVDMGINEWGLFQGPEDLRMVEPSRFAQKISEELIRFAETAFRLLDFPKLLAKHPDVLAKVQDQPRELKRLMSTLPEDLYFTLKPTTPYSVSD